MFASHHRLGNLTAVIDLNGQQAMGLTSDVLALPNLRQRWESFGWRTTEVDGHSMDELTHALGAPDTRDDLPRLVLAKTKFGSGVSFMEEGRSPARPHLETQPINWHYLPMSDEEFRAAIFELGAED
jgi:transketolase